jgi:hypothetical protein
MTHDTNDAGGGAVAITADYLVSHIAQSGGLGAAIAHDLQLREKQLEQSQAETARLRAFVASLKAKAQQSIIILPRHFEAFERGETGA